MAPDKPERKIMSDIVYYYPELDIDGTADVLIDQSFRYTDDFTDEALDKIEEIAINENKECRIPRMMKLARKRTEGLPYEIMIAEYIRDGRISYSETKEYGEIEIYNEGNRVLLSVVGQDDEGFFTAANAYNTEEFIGGIDDDPDWLEHAISQTLFYGKNYEE